MEQAQEQLKAQRLRIASAVEGQAQWLRSSVAQQSQRLITAVEEGAQSLQVSAQSALTQTIELPGGKVRGKKKKGPCFLVFGRSLLFLGLCHCCMNSTSSQNSFFFVSFTDCRFESPCRTCTPPDQHCPSCLCHCCCCCPPPTHPRRETHPGCFAKSQGTDTTCS